MSTGRYIVRDAKTGRTFWVEPISSRDERVDDKVFVNGGSSGTAEKNKSHVEGGSVKELGSVITSENGFTHITTLPAGTSPNDYIEMLCRTGKRVGEN